MDARHFIILIGLTLSAGCLPPMADDGDFESTSETAEPCDDPEPCEPTSAEDCEAQGTSAFVSCFEACAEVDPEWTEDADLCLPYACQHECWEARFEFNAGCSEDACMDPAEAAELLCVARAHRLQVECLESCDTVNGGSPAYDFCYDLLTYDLLHCYSEAV